MKPMFIGLMGKKRSGKDSFAAALLKEGFTRYAFADPLKRAALKADPWIDNAVLPGLLVPSPRRLSEVIEALGWDMAKDIPEVRRYLQAFGLGMREEINENVWVNATMQRVHFRLSQGQPAVITDVRFPNEADTIRAAGGLLIRIVRRGVVSDDDHVSENALNDYPAHLTVRNNDALDVLETSAQLLVKMYSA